MVLCVPIHNFIHNTLTLVFSPSDSSRVGVTKYYVCFPTKHVHCWTFWEAGEKSLLIRDFRMIMNGTDVRACRLSLSECRLTFVLYRIECKGILSSAGRWRLSKDFNQEIPPRIPTSTAADHIWSAPKMTASVSQSPLCIQQTSDFWLITLQCSKLSVMVMIGDELRIIGGHKVYV